MYNIIKNIIKTGNFKVNDIANKIDTLWITGKLTDGEREDLNQMITEYLNPETEAPSLEEQHKRISEQIDAIKVDIKDIKNRITALEGGQTETQDPETVIMPEWEQWEPWDGISKNYQFDAIVIRDGKYYKNVLKDIQNTWEPGTPGVDERYWKEITEEEAQNASV